MQKKDVDREARLRELALKLFFTLEKQGSQFALYRDVDVSKPVRHHHLETSRASRWLIRVAGKCA
jgi:hypothetical protein